MFVYDRSAQKVDRECEQINGKDGAFLRYYRIAPGASNGRWDHYKDSGKRTYRIEHEMEHLLVSVLLKCGKSPVKVKCDR